ncbi:MAG TPA: hypothetical protein VGW75_04965 [Solirubrobacteraceae bacterium]|jgi:hypothetical protein|nr:hypothetical protein [Solirubrobacteraceae bacterium]
MNLLLDPVKWGAQTTFAVASTAVKIGVNTVRTVELLLGRDAEDDAEQRYGAVATPVGGDEPGGAPPGGTGRRAPSTDATPRQARTRTDSVETSGAPPEPTSAAGASGGVAGTVAAPGDAAAADAPDPTAPSIPRGERRPTAVEPPAPESRFDRVDTDASVVETEGAADPGATLRVDAPWDGYDKLRAPEIVARVRESDDATKAVVRLYEQTHKKRKSVLAATEG